MASGSHKYGCCSTDNPADEKSIECSVCSKSFHLACLSISETGRDDISSSNWKCPSCICSSRKVAKKDTTPVRNSTTSRGNKRPAINSPSPSPSTKDKEDIRSIVRDVIKTELGEMMTQFNKSLVAIINKEMEPIRNQIKEVTDSMSYISDRFDELEKDKAEANKSLKALEGENLKLKTTVNDLSMRLNYIEQQSRANNLELQCVPENKNENLYKIVHKLGEVVDCKLSENDIAHCTRTAKIRTDNKRPRSIVVQLASPKIRDQLLASVITYNKAHPEEKLNSKNLGFPGESSPVYVTEHLAPSNKALHAAARIKCKEMDYEFVWIKNGRIFVRKNKDADHILIKNMDSLRKIV